MAFNNPYAKSESNDEVENIIPTANQSYKIEFELKTPLLQIGIDNNGTTTKQKTMSYYNKELGYAQIMPVFSSNALRGVMRRIGVEYTIELLKKQYEDVAITAENLNLFASGASGNIINFDAMSFDEVNKIREKSPLLSIFGAGLSAIEGKLSISELRVKDLEQELTTNTEGKLVSKRFISQIGSVRIDEVKRKSNISSFLSQDDADKWSQIAVKIANDKAKLTELNKKRENGEITKSETSELLKLEKEFKNTNTQMIHEKEFVMPNTKFVASFSNKTRFELTEIEEGLFCAIMVRLTQTALGSSIKDGFGHGNWNIEDTEGNYISSKVNPEFFTGKKSLDISQNILEKIQKYNDWVLKQDTSILDIVKFKENLKKSSK